MGGIFVERIGDGYSDIFVAGTSICLFLALYDLKTETGFKESILPYF